MNIALFIGMAERLPREIDSIEADIRARENVLRDRKLLTEAVEHLRTSWEDGNDRHFRPHWFFVKRYALELREGQRARISCYEKFWPREIVSDRALAERKRPDMLGSLADCADAACERCGKKDLPVIGRKIFVGDRASSDEWRIDLYALCDSCTALTTVVTDFQSDTVYY